MEVSCLHLPSPLIPPPPPSRYQQELTEARGVIEGPQGDEEGERAKLVTLVHSLTHWVFDVNLLQDVNKLTLLHQAALVSSSCYSPVQVEWRAMLFLLKSFFAKVKILQFLAKNHGLCIVRCFDQFLSALITPPWKVLRS